MPIFQRFYLLAFVKTSNNKKHFTYFQDSVGTACKSYKKIQRLGELTYSDFGK